MEMETRLNDNVVIPERIKKMTREECAAEIDRLEKEAAAKKNEILKKRN